MKSRKNGSITVFMSLMLMVIASLLFTLLEGSRYIMLGMMAMLNSQSVTESMFAEYNVPAYKNYHLFMMDSGYGTGEILLSKVNARMQELGQENLNPTVLGIGRHTNFLQMDVTDSSVAQYELATDQHASALLKQIAQVSKKEIAVDMLEQAYQKVTGVQESYDQGKKADEYLDGAFDTIEKAKEEAKEAEAQAEAGVQQMACKVQMAEGIQKNPCRIQMQDSASKGVAWNMPSAVARSMQSEENNGILLTDISLDMPSGPSDSHINADNPMEDVKSAKSSPLLAQVLSSGDGISAKQISKGESVEKRALNTGNYGESGSVGAIDKLLVVQYLKKYTSNYRNKVSMPHALAYEQEYILFGKYSDEDNLEKMAGRLLLLREGINFAYLLTDSAKCEEALALATAIALATGIPAAAKAIQMGILASWAYSESIVELRTLFSGEKVAAVKTYESWNVSLPEVATVLLDTSIKSKAVNGGLDYEDYLQTFLALESMEKIGIRFANLLEKNIRLYQGYEQVKLDCMVTAMETDSTYQAKQVFLTFVTIERLSKKGYRFQEKYKFSYTDKKDGT